MHDSGGCVCGDGNEFEEVACRIRSNHEEPLLAVILVLDVPEGVLPGMGDRDVVDSMLPSRRGDLHTRKPYLYEAHASRLRLRRAAAPGERAPYGARTSPWDVALKVPVNDALARCPRSMSPTAPPRSPRARR